MRISLVLAGVAVVLGASACGSDDTPTATGTDGPTGGPTGVATGGASPTAACSAAAAPKPASSRTGPLGEVVLTATDPTCAAVTVTVDGTGLTPQDVTVGVGDAVAFTFDTDSPSFQVGLELPGAQASGVTRIYRFEKQDHYFVSVSGSVVGEVTVGSPTSFPNPLATDRVPTGIPSPSLPTP